MSELAVQAGKPDEALASLTRPGIYWDPTYVFTSQEFHLGFAYFMKGDYHTALEHLQKETTLDPLYTLAFLAASYAELGRLDEARATVAKIREKNPDATLDVVRSVWAFRYEADTERLLGALRKAGLPEK
jgi:tetratricopeptide (TPR) repeat protein